MTSRIIEGAQLRLRVSARSDVGECRRAAKRLAEQYKFDDTSVGRICIIANELANNIVTHAQTGELLVQMLDDGINRELELLAIDSGPGMKDVGQCLRDGYSTAGTPGTGFGAVSRLSTTFDVFSAVDQGTVVLSRTVFGGAARPGSASFMPALEVGAICLAIEGETACGDAWRIAESENSIGVMVADGLGHGPLAAEASLAVCKAYSNAPFDEPSRIMEGLHRAASGTRGAAAACVILRIPSRKAAYAGVGNICGRIVTSERSEGMVSHNGTLGVQLLRTQQFEYDWPENSRVVMHSDGLATKWSLQDYPELSRRHCATIAAVLYRDFSRKRDDVTVLVATYRR
jgi:anti-sigma regulatory factor (Ser/Thr protein kinase)